MKIRSLLAAGLVFGALQSNAQAWIDDSVSMGAQSTPPAGPAYFNDVHYSLKNGQQLSGANTNWHLAFQTTPQGPYGNVSVFANHVQARVRVFPAHVAASTSFTSFNPADTSTIATNANEVFNTDTSWNFGAFNRMANPANPFDYSWGMYDMSTHEVVGDSLYLLKVGNAFYKFWIQTYVSTPSDSVQWKFRIAKLDGTADTTIRIYRVGGGFADRMFAYYNVNTQTVLDRELPRTNWDILFTRYKEYIPGAPGSPFYNVTGVLSNFDVTVAEINNLPPDTAVLDTINMTFARSMKEIGSDWKTFNNTTMTWTLKDSLSYFIKTKNTNEYYQLQFTGFGGSATGMIYFKKRKVGDIPSPTNVINSTAAQAVNAFFLAPNPAADNAGIVIDTKENIGFSRILVTDLTGRVVYQTAVSLQQGMNAYNLNVSNLPSGTYLVSVSNGSWKVAEKLMVQH